MAKSVLYLTGHIQQLPWSVSRGSVNLTRPFGVSTVAMLSQQVHRQINKQVKATVWMAHDYPLKLRHIMPALEILSVRVS